jgi:hypothetical protein
MDVQYDRYVMRSVVVTKLPHLLRLIDVLARMLDVTVILGKQSIVFPQI